MAVIAAQIHLLHLRGVGGSLARIDADGNDVVVFSQIEAHDADRAGQSVEHFAAQHRASVIDERDNDRSLAEELAQADVFPRLVAEVKIERKLLVQMLIDADLLKNLRA